MTVPKLESEILNRKIDKSLFGYYRNESLNMEKTMKNETEILNRVKKFSEKVLTSHSYVQSL